MSAGLGVAALRDLATSVNIVVVPIPADVVTKIDDAAYLAGDDPGQHLQRPDRPTSPSAAVQNFLVTHDGVSATTPSTR